MVYCPDFVVKSAEYENEKQQVKTEKDWIVFRNKWFDISNWPEKQADQLAKESLNKKGPLLIGGRKWGYRTLICDISPEARYEFCYTYYTVGYKFIFPEYMDEPKTARNGWSQECPFCEISTHEIGDEECPICKRKLIYSKYLGE